MSLLLHRKGISEFKKEWTCISEIIIFNVQNPNIFWFRTSKKESIARKFSTRIVCLCVPKIEYFDKSQSLLEYTYFL